MTSFRILHRLAPWLAAVALVFSGVAAIAQAEPTLNQVYEAAQGGRLADAQVMMQQVLVAHPDSAKAHFVDAEIAARAGKIQRARDSLARAEKLAPGLPFAKPESVTSLRSKIASGASASPRSDSNVDRPVPQQRTSETAPAPASASSFPLGLGLALGGGALALVFLLRRRKAVATNVGPAGFPDRGGANGGLAGPQAFGGGGGGAAPMGYGQPGYGQPGYGQPGYGQAPGMGSRVMGGLATGMAVGAGVMAAEAIGRNMMGHDRHPDGHTGNAVTSNDNVPLADNNYDMGGQNFGVNDAGSWDDGGGTFSSGDVGGGGGGDWDT
jgi:uncharacterized protein